MRQHGAGYRRGVKPVDKKKKLVIIDDEPYYPAKKFEDEVNLLTEFAHTANVTSIVALILAAVSITLAILL